VTTKEVVDARKTRIDLDEAWTLLKDAKSVTIAKGKKFQKFDSLTDEKEAVLKQAMGPSGNLRAPTYRVGADYIVGFNEDLYQQWVK